MLADHYSTMTSVQRQLIGLIKDFLIQKLNKFPDLDGKGTNWYNSVEEFILLNGTPMVLRPVPESTFEYGKCYANAEAVALHHHGNYFYVEGYAIPIVDNEQSYGDVFQHAWVADARTGNALDPTWKDHSAVALGCVFPVGINNISVHSRRDEPGRRKEGYERITKFNSIREYYTPASILIPNMSKNLSMAQIFDKDYLEITTEPARFCPLQKRS